MLEMEVRTDETSSSEARLSSAEKSSLRETNH